MSETRIWGCTKIRVITAISSAHVVTAWCSGYDNHRKTALGAVGCGSTTQRIMVIFDEIAVRSAYKARPVDDYPPKNSAYNKMSRRRTPLSKHVHIPRVRLPLSLSCPQTLVRGFRLQRCSI